MRAFATTERSTARQRLRPLNPTPASLRHAVTGGSSEVVLLDQLLGRLADLVADRVLERNPAVPDAEASDWLDARGAAEYLGMHRDTVRKLAAQRAIPDQDGPRCKLYFRRAELDDWRCSARSSRTGAVGLRAMS